MGARSRLLSLLSVAASFRAPQYVLLENWRIALGHRALQVAAVGVVVVLLSFQDSWAEQERPDGVFNPWAETGTSADAGNISDYRETHPYCANDAWSVRAPGAQPPLPKPMIAQRP